MRRVKCFAEKVPSALHSGHSSLKMDDDSQEMEDSSGGRKLLKAVKTIQI